MGSLGVGMKGTQGGQKGTQRGCGGYRRDKDNAGLGTAVTQMGDDDERSTEAPRAALEGERGGHGGDVGGGHRGDVGGTQRGCGGHRMDMGDIEGTWGDTQRGHGGDTEGM